MALYGTALVYAVANGFEDGAGWLALPLGGPWAAIGAQKIQCSGRRLPTDFVETSAWKKALVKRGAHHFSRSTGLSKPWLLTLVFVGMGIKTTELVRNDVATVRLELKQRSVGLTGNF